MLVALAALISACGKEGAESGPATPQSAPTPATLDGKSGLPESWTVEDAPTQLLFFTQIGMKVSASCRKPDGTLDCAAFQYVKSGMPTEIAKRELDGHASPGSKVCLKMNNQIVTGKNSVGSTDTFCKFPDGSLITVGTLEQYSLRIIQ